ncbi:MAG: LemA family protein [Candidatus Micrarchaeales archaeon]|jgi:LemA protein
MSILLTAGAIVIVILAGLFVLIYNNLIRLRNNVTKAWSNIDVILKKRHDLIGNLVETVRGYMKYEKTLLVKVTALRSTWADVEGDNDIGNKMQASNQISASLKTLFADVENYPDLKADQSFTTLQQELIEIENEIADRREFYNDSVNEYNIKIAIVPYDFFSGMLKYKPMPFFEAPEGERGAVKVNV